MLLAISGLSPTQVGLAYVLAALSGSGIATAYVMPWAMVPDIIEIDEARTGQRREGSYYAFPSSETRRIMGRSDCPLSIVSTPPSSLTEEQLHV